MFESFAQNVIMIENHIIKIKGDYTMKEANENVFIPGYVNEEAVDFAANGITVIDGVVYADTEDGVLKMDCFYDEAIEGPKPAIIWAHGGAFIEPHVSRKNRPEDKFLYLAKHGYFVVSIDYRFAQVRPFPCQVEDCKCAVRFLRANAAQYGIDPDHIAFWGESCGGQLAGLMAVSEGIPAFEDKGGYAGVSSEIQAAVSWYGALNYQAFHDIRAVEDPKYLSAFEVIYGGKPEEKKDAIVQGNPMTYLEKKHCPFLAMCSTGDVRVPYTVNTEFCERAKDYGNYAEYIIVKDQGHGYIKGEEYDNALYGFFDRFLKS